MPSTCSASSSGINKSGSTPTSSPTTWTTNADSTRMPPSPRTRGFGSLKRNDARAQLAAQLSESNALKLDLKAKMDKLEKYYTDFLRPPLAPIYRPTAEEFTDPIAYVAKIKPEAEKYGVVKIVPPSDFVPTFAINGSTFKFTPRVQKLNEIEASIRERLQGINLDIDCSTDKLVEAGSNFGFYDANTSYNLDTFREFADKFKKEYSRKPLKEITLEEVEKESWWDIIREEAVSVKYGADLRVDKKQATKQEQQDGMRSA